MFQTFLITPLYNTFVFLIGVTHGSVGFAILLLTLLIRIIFYPAFSASIRTQMGMQSVQSELDEINRVYKDNAEERAKRTMLLFKEKKIRPFASFVALLVQLPVFFALYFAFFREGLPHIATALLYPFVSVPGAVDTTFFGIDLLAKNNLILVVLVAATQYLAIRYSLTRTSAKPKDPAAAAAHQVQRSMMLYGMPALLASVAYSFPGAVALYFTMSNCISIGQEWVIKHQNSA